ncbi:MAG TPA: M15 family metallopeptidase, partial [Smithella sp.]|nr:M15 family metallopeptidase [Smithella sp.]
IADTNKLSLHSFGRAVDINPIQNPVIYPAGLIAPEGAVYRPQNKGVFTGDHPVVQEFLSRGWHWGGNFEQPKDYHHFEKP